MTTKHIAAAELSRRGIERFCVLWLRNGKECRSPWFSSRERAALFYEIAVRKYGRAVIWRD